MMEARVSCFEEDDITEEEEVITVDSPKWQEL
jgi:hypothetical protein